MNIKKKPILVTGGAGCVGSNIVKKLEKRGAEVTVIDNLSAYPFDYLHEYGVGHMENVNFIKGDINDHELISEFYAITNVPILINTSMNVMGEPIVNTPEQAYQMILKTDMDYLVMGNNLMFSRDWS